MRRAGSEELIGRSIADVAAERGADPVDVLIDVVLARPAPAHDWSSRRSCRRSVGPTRAGGVRAGVWRDDRTVLGGSDAGAHADLMCHANYTTMLLGESVRERGLFTLEEAVRQITDVPARLYGLRDRGRVAEGWTADLVVFDPDRRRQRPAQARHDLPGGGERLYAEAQRHRARARERARDRRRRCAHRRARRARCYGPAATPTPSPFRERQP